MSERVVYLNGEYLPVSEAKISVDDRGFLFADGVYEVIRYVNGLPRAMDRHLIRLEKSLQEIDLKAGHVTTNLRIISDELLLRNSCKDATIYLQITRGAAKRTHAYPPQHTPITVYANASAMPPLTRKSPLKKVSAITWPDQRWLKCGIKSISLLPNVIASEMAARQGAYDAILHRDGIMTEASARGVFFFKDGVAYTHPADGTILPSVTRSIVMELLPKLGIPIREVYAPLEDLKSADEIILIGTGTAVVAVTELDQALVAHGNIGVMTQRLFQAYVEWVLTEHLV